MNLSFKIPEPFIFNPLKHHIGYIKEFIDKYIENPASEIPELTVNLKHIGTSVMDIYTGPLQIKNVCSEVTAFLKEHCLMQKELFSIWAGINVDNYRIISLSDDSEWTLKFHNDPLRFVHIFPARNSHYTFRVKSNTLKSALIYNIMIGKDMVTENDLNKVRPLLGLSPVKDTTDTKAILEMIEILRD